EVNGNASKTTAGDWLANSDRRIKTAIEEVRNGLKTINRLRPVKFRYTEDYMKKHPVIDDQFYYNFVAQEFQEVFPGSVQDDGTGLLQVDTYNVRPYLVKAVQELSEEKDSLARENEELKNRVTRLEKLVEKLLRQSGAD
ncbi:MAG: tail fiber domain-containing protein, partial [Planctomycetota bacterium]|nr:tail fiber domain-containing protein [Planctomycetota bacterium]